MGGVEIKIIKALIYLIPSIYALITKHEERLKIILVNLFLGWTVIGWFYAFGVAFLDLFKEEEKEEGVYVDQSSRKKALDAEGEVDGTTTGHVYIDDEAIKQFETLEKLLNEEKIDEISQMISEDKIKMIKKNKKGDTVLHVLASYRQAGLLKEAIAKGAKVNESNFKGFIPIHLAAENGDVQSMKVLLENGSHVNEKNVNKTTPLMFSVQSKNFDAVKLMLEHDAKVNEIAANKATALQIAEYMAKDDIIKILLAYGAEKNLMEVEGVKVAPLKLDEGLKAWYNLIIISAVGWFVLFFWLIEFENTFRFSLIMELIIFSILMGTINSSLVWIFLIRSKSQMELKAFTDELIRTQKQILSIFCISFVVFILIPSIALFFYNFARLVVFGDMQFSEFRSHIPQLSFEVVINWIRSMIK